MHRVSNRVSWFVMSIGPSHTKGSVTTTYARYVVLGGGGGGRFLVCKVLMRTAVVSRVLGTGGWGRNPCVHKRSVATLFGYVRKFVLGVQGFGRNLSGSVGGFSCTACRSQSYLDRFLK